MGWTWEVEVYHFDRKSDAWVYTVTYAGTGLWGAISEMRAARRDGTKCIRLTWRP